MRWEKGKCQTVKDVLSVSMIEPMMTYALRYSIEQGGMSAKNTGEAIRYSIPVVSTNELWAWQRTLETMLKYRDASYLGHDQVVGDAYEYWSSIYRAVAKESLRREKNPY